MKIKVDDSFYDSINRFNSPLYKIKEFFRSLKNRFFKPYTTIKPRYLGHNFCDHTELLPHLMFESLSRFVENECSPGHVEWYGDDGHKILVGTNNKYVRDEIQDLYDWWHKEYITYYKNEHPTQVELKNQLKEKRLHDVDLKGFFEILNKDKSERSSEENQYLNILDKINAFENEMDSEIKRRMHRLINIRNYMWT